MAASTEFSESNGASETVTDGISNLNYGNTDAANLTPSSYPITAGSNSYVKWVRFHVSDMGGSNKVSNLHVWKSAGAYVTSEGIYSNLATATYTAATYATPDTVGGWGSLVPTADPGAANLGIGGALDGSLTAAGYSDYWRSQLRTGTDTPPGNTNTKTFTLQYDEQ